MIISVKKIPVKERTDNREGAKTLRRSDAKIVSCYPFAEYKGKYNIT